MGCIYSWVIFGVKVVGNWGEVDYVGGFWCGCWLGFWSFFFVKVRIVGVCREGVIGGDF